MYLLKAPVEKYGPLPPRSALLTDEVLFTNNIALCTKYYWKKFHVLQGCVDISPKSFEDIRRSRKLRSILFHVSGGIGDVMWSMPVMKALKSLYPQAKICVATSKRTMPIFAHVLFADTCVEDEYWNLHRLIKSCDEVYDFGGIATVFKEYMKMEPVEATFKIAELPLPRERADMRPELKVSVAEGQAAADLLLEKGIDIRKDKFVVMALESSTPNRNWPYSYARDLSKMLATENIKVVWLSESQDIATTYYLPCKCGFELEARFPKPPTSLSFICPHCKNATEPLAVSQDSHVVNLAGKTDIRKAAAIIALADAFVGPNSALMVIATSFLIPSIGLFGAFDPTRISKYYDKFKYIWGKQKCSPCSEHWTECQHGHPAPCMKSIQPVEVFSEIISLISRYPRTIKEKEPIE